MVEESGLSKMYNSTDKKLFVGLDHFVSSMKGKNVSLIQRQHSLCFITLLTGNPAYVMDDVEEC